MVRLKLKEIRKRLGLRQQDVAQRAGMSRTHYTDIENGKRPANTRNLQALAHALEVSPHELFDTAAESNVPPGELDALIASGISSLKTEDQKKMALSYLHFLLSQEDNGDTPEG